jgi:hypothetical protein
MPKRKSEKQLQSQLQLQQLVVVALSQLVDIEPFVDAGLVFDLVLDIFLDWTAADLARLCSTCKRMRESAQLLILSHKQFRTANLENLTENQLAYVRRVQVDSWPLPTVCLNLPKLEKLSCYLTVDMTDVDLQSLSVFTSLTSLSLSNCKLITDEGVLSSLSNLSALTTLGFNDCRSITDLGMQFLSSLNNLTSLDLSKCGATQTQMSNFIHFIGDPNTTITDHGVQFLSGLTKLEHLDLSMCGRITDQGMQFLPNLANLKRLDMRSCTSITNLGAVETLSSLTSLTHLNVRECTSLSDLGVQSLSSLTTLTSLDLGGCTFITDLGVQSLSTLTALKLLNLGSCRLITDVGVHALSSLTSLTYLNLHGSGGVSIWKPSRGRSITQLLSEDLAPYP